MDLPVEQVSIADLPPPPEGYELVSIDVLMRVRRKTPVNDAA
jgi:Fur family iron response transcriptional regulator